MRFLQVKICVRSARNCIGARVVSSEIAVNLGSSSGAIGVVEEVKGVLETVVDSSVVVEEEVVSVVGVSVVEEEERLVVVLGVEEGSAVVDKSASADTCS